MKRMMKWTALTLCAVLAALGFAVYFAETLMAVA